MEKVQLSTGTKALSLLHAKFYPWIKELHKNLNIDLSQNNEGPNSRLFSSTGELICLQTRGFLEYNKAKNKESYENLQKYFFLFPTSLSLIHTIEYTADSVLHNFC